MSLNQLLAEFSFCTPSAPCLDLYIQTDRDLLPGQGFQLGGSQKGSRAVGRNFCGPDQLGLRAKLPGPYWFPEKFTTSFSVGISFLCTSAGPLASEGFQPSPRPTTSNDTRE